MTDIRNFRDAACMLACGACVAAMFWMLANSGQFTAAVAKAAGRVWCLLS